MATDEKFDKDEREEGKEMEWFMEEDEWDGDIEGEYYREETRKIAEEYERQGWPYDDVILFCRFMRRHYSKERRKNASRD